MNDIYFNKFKDDVKKLTSNEYSVLDSLTVENGKKKLYKLKHNSCGYEYTTTRYRFINLGRRCPHCNMSKKLTFNDLNQKLIDLNLQKEYEIKTKIIRNNQTKIKFHHTLCNKDFMMTSAHFFNSGERCPYCQHPSKRKDPEEYKKFIHELTNGTFDVLSDYKTKKDPVKFRHNICKNEFLAIPGNFRNHGLPICPHCSISSYAENHIEDILIKNNILFVSQYRLPDCKDKRPLPFDFAIFDDKNELLALIEYDGKQHDMNNKYNSCSKFWKNGRKQDIERHDQIKTEYCKCKDIKLIRLNKTNKNILLDELKNLFKRDIKDSTTIPW